MYSVCGKCREGNWRSLNGGDGECRPNGVMVGISSCNYMYGTCTLCIHLAGA